MLDPNTQLMHSNRILEAQLERAHKALQLACEELFVAMPNKPHAGEPEAWLAYAQAVIERDRRNRVTEEEENDERQSVARFGVGA